MLPYLMKRHSQEHIHHGDSGFNDFIVWNSTLYVDITQRGVDLVVFLCWAQYDNLVEISRK
jgi:hypothetical protein